MYRAYPTDYSRIGVVQCCGYARWAVVDTAITCGLGKTIALVHTIYAFFEEGTYHMPVLRLASAATATALSHWCLQL